jgi:hypothetical protein
MILGQKKYFLLLLLSYSAVSYGMEEGANNQIESSMEKSASMIEKKQNTMKDTIKQSLDYYNYHCNVIDRDEIVKRVVCYSKGNQNHIGGLYSFYLDINNFFTSSISDLSLFDVNSVVYSKYLFSNFHQTASNIFFNKNYHKLNFKHFESYIQVLVWYGIMVEELYDSEMLNKHAFFEKILDLIAYEWFFLAGGSLNLEQSNAIQKWCNQYQQKNKEKKSINFLGYYFDKELAINFIKDRINEETLLFAIALNLFHYNQYDEVQKKDFLLLIKKDLNAVLELDDDTFKDTYKIDKSQYIKSLLNKYQDIIYTCYDNNYKNIPAFLLQCDLLNALGEKNVAKVVDRYFVLNDDDKKNIINELLNNFDPEYNECIINIIVDDHFTDAMLVDQGARIILLLGSIIDALPENSDDKEGNKEKIKICMHKYKEIIFSELKNNNDNPLNDVKKILAFCGNTNLLSDYVLFLYNSDNKISGRIKSLVVDICKDLNVRIELINKCIHHKKYPLVCDIIHDCDDAVLPGLLKVMPECLAYVDFSVLYEKSKNMECGTEYNTFNTVIRKNIDFNYHVIKSFVDNLSKLAKKNCIEYKDLVTLDRMCHKLYQYSEHINCHVNDIQRDTYFDFLNVVCDCKDFSKNYYFAFSLFSIFDNLLNHDMFFNDVDIKYKWRKILKTLVNNFIKSKDILDVIVYHMSQKKYSCLGMEIFFDNDDFIDYLSSLEDQSLMNQIIKIFFEEYLASEKDFHYIKNSSQENCCKVNAGCMSTLECYAKRIERIQNLDDYNKALLSQIRGWFQVCDFTRNDEGTLFNSLSMLQKNYDENYQNTFKGCSFLTQSLLMHYWQSACQNFTDRSSSEVKTLLENSDVVFQKFSSEQIAKRREASMGVAKSRSYVCKQDLITRFKDMDDVAYNTFLAEYDYKNTDLNIDWIETQNMQDLMINNLMLDYDEPDWLCVQHLLGIKDLPGADKEKQELLRKIDCLVFNWWCQEAVFESTSKTNSVQQYFDVITVLFENNKFFSLPSACQYNVLERGIKVLSDFHADNADSSYIRQNKYLGLFRAMMIIILSNDDFQLKFKNFLQKKSNQDNFYKVLCIKYDDKKDKNINLYLNIMQEIKIKNELFKELIEFFDDKSDRFLNSLFSMMYAIRTKNRPNNFISLLEEYCGSDDIIDTKKIFFCNIILHELASQSDFNNSRDITNILLEKITTYLSNGKTNQVNMEDFDLACFIEILSKFVDYDDSIQSHIIKLLKISFFDNLDTGNLIQIISLLGSQAGTQNHCILLLDYYYHLVNKKKYDLKKSIVNNLKTVIIPGIVNNQYYDKDIYQSLFQLEKSLAILFAVEKNSNISDNLAKCDIAKIAPYVLSVSRYLALINGCIDDYKIDYANISQIEYLDTDFGKLSLAVHQKFLDDQIIDKDDFIINDKFHQIFSDGQFQPHDSEKRILDYRYCFGDDTQRNEFYDKNLLFMETRFSSSKESLLHLDLDDLHFPVFASSKYDYDCNVIYSLFYWNYVGAYVGDRLKNHSDFSYQRKDCWSIYNNIGYENKNIIDSLQKSCDFDLNYMKTCILKLFENLLNAYVFLQRLDNKIKDRSQDDQYKKEFTKYMYDVIKSYGFFNHEQLDIKDLEKNSLFYKLLLEYYPSMRFEFDSYCVIRELVRNNNIHHSIKDNFVRRNKHFISTFDTFQTNLSECVSNAFDSDQFFTMLCNFDTYRDCVDNVWIKDFSDLEINNRTFFESLFPYANRLYQYFCFSFKQDHPQGLGALFSGIFGKQNNLLLESDFERVGFKKSMDQKLWDKIIFVEDTKQKIILSLKYFGQCCVGSFVIECIEQRVKKLQQAKEEDHDKEINDRTDIIEVYNKFLHTLIIKKIPFDNNKQAPSLLNNVLYKGAEVIMRLSHPQQQKSLENE